MPNPQPKIDHPGPAAAEKRRVAGDAAVAPQPRPFWPAVAIPLLAIAVYSSGWNNQYVHWDDTAYIRTNPHLTEPDGLQRIWLTLESPQYYPLTFTTYWIEFQLWGDWPRGYFITNVLLHALNSWLVFIVARRLGASTGVAWLAGALFAVHPMQVASVAWLAQRKNVLCGLFALLTILFYADGRRRGERAAYLAACLTFLAAMLAKTAVAPLPLSLVMADVIISRSGWGRAWLRSIPLFALALAIGCVTVFAEARLVPDAGSLALRPLAGAAALAFYLQKSVWPDLLIAIYPRSVVEGIALARLGLVLLVAIGVIGWLRWCGWLRPLAAWGLAHFAVMLVPVLGFVNFGYLRIAPVADHFAYLALIGLFIAVAASAEAVGSVLRSRGTRTLLAVGVTVAVLLPLSIKTFAQVPLWRDGVTLWTDTIAYSPASSLAHNNLGVALATTGQSGEALIHYRESARLDRDFVKARMNVAITLRDLGRLDDAELAFRRELTEHPENRDAPALLAQVLIQQQRFEEAIAIFDNEIAKRPDDADAHYNLANALQQSGKLNEALVEFEAAVRLNPRHVPALVNWGVALLDAGDSSAAISRLQQAFALDPSNFNAAFSLALALSNANRLDEAIARYLDAIELNPNAAPVYAHLGVVLNAKGQRSDAVRVLKQAIAIDPDNLLARLSLGALAIEAGRTEEAIQQFQAARKIDGFSPVAAAGLADALAAAARLEEARNVAREAIELARELHQDALADEIAVRAAAYGAATQSAPTRAPTEQP